MTLLIIKNSTMTSFLRFLAVLQFLGIVGCENFDRLIIKEIDYYPNGRVRFMVEYDKVDQVEIVNHFYPNGRKKSYHELRNSQIKGVALHYYENGDIKDSLFYEDGVLEKVVKSYYPKGKIKLIANYKNGKVHGESFLYYPNTVLESYCRYVDDSLHYEEKYDSLGNFQWTYTVPIVESKSDTFLIGDTARFFIYHPAPDTSINYFVELGLTSGKDKKVKFNRINENHEGSSFFNYIPTKSGTFFILGNVGFVDDKKIKNIYPFEKRITVISRND